MNSLRFVFFSFLRRHFHLKLTNISYLQRHLVVIKICVLYSCAVVVCCKSLYETSRTFMNVVKFLVFSWTSGFSFLTQSVRTPQVLFQHKAPNTSIYITIDSFLFLISINRNRCIFFTVWLSQHIEHMKHPNHHEFILYSGWLMELIIYSWQNHLETPQHLWQSSLNTETKFTGFPIKNKLRIEPLSIIQSPKTRLYIWHSPTATCSGDKNKGTLCIPDCGQCRKPGFIFNLE